MRISRKCPYCGEKVIVIKTITGIETSRKTERLQHLSCMGCGATAYGIVKTRVKWNPKPSQ